MSNETMQKDLVLSINEYAYVEDETKGHVVCWVGPAKTSLSQSDKLVTFNTVTKRFESCSFENAINLFCSAPENWYIILKNPAKNNVHPKPGTSNILPDEMQIGKKINIRGPETFALYPGQMAKVVKGHSLRSNQYLLARVYEAESANSDQGEVLDAEGKKVETKTNYVNGQLLVIKGTEVSFYIPPTGIEVIPVDNDCRNGYTREAITLERLEYCILKDEDGNKRYVHGPEVVFPTPTESFVESPNHSYIFRAIELSKISGIYVKVIAEYTEKKDEEVVIHPVGEELFITGDDQMIYYPRPEHAIINYDNKIMHHAIAIPEGEGRYIMNRLTGEIKTVVGPKMYLPDPRYEVVVKRKLSDRECMLYYPNNDEALAYNQGLNEKAVEKSLNNKFANLDNFAFTTAMNCSSTLANLEAKANISRGTSYTKPRTITLDNKYDGVVTIDIWTGYAVNIISKNGKREVANGPRTIMLDYDQKLGEIMLSTGNPKTTDNLEHTVFLNYENNKISDTIEVETKDFVKAKIKVSYCVNFDSEYKDKWFDVENYVKYLCDRERSIIKRKVKEYTIEQFYQSYSEIVRNSALDASNSETVGMFFPENGMRVTDCEVLNCMVEGQIQKILLDHQYEMVQKALELSDAEKRIAVAEKLAEAENKEQELRSAQLINRMNLDREEAIRKLDIQTEINRTKEAESYAAKQAENDMQTIINAIAEAGRERKRLDDEQKLNTMKVQMEIEKAKNDSYAETVAKIMQSIGPDLVASMTAKANTDLATAIAQSVSPYSIANGESVSDTVNKMLRGLPIEDILDKCNLNK